MIVATADDLFYRQGFEHTSFADIAAAVGISRGNFYHHFKSKDDILEAVIGKRRADRIAMMACWETAATAPLERIERFIDILKVNGEKIRLHGCPIGTLTSELAKLAHPAQSDAVGLLMLFRQWLARQFVALGRVEDADRLAQHLLSRSQGAASLYNAFKDDNFVEGEIADMKSWLQHIAVSAEKTSPAPTPLNRP